MAVSRKDQRLELRVPSDIKALIARAADLRGCSTSDFVLSSAVTAALQTIDKSEVLLLSARDSERFYAAITNPPEPSARQNNAARKHADAVEVRW